MNSVANFSHHVPTGNPALLRNTSFSQYNRANGWGVKNMSFIFQKYVQKKLLIKTLIFKKVPLIEWWTRLNFSLIPLFTKNKGIREDEKGAVLLLRGRSQNKGFTSLMPLINVETLFLPNPNNKTTTVEVRHISSLTSLPHFHGFNKVMRLLFWDIISSTEVVLLKNKVKIRFYHLALGRGCTSSQQPIPTSFQREIKNFYNSKLF